MEIPVSAPANEQNVLHIVFDGLTSYVNLPSIKEPARYMHLILFVRNVSLVFCKFCFSSFHCAPAYLFCLRVVHCVPCIYLVPESLLSADAYCSLQYIPVLQNLDLSACLQDCRAFLFLDLYTCVIMRLYDD